MIPFKTGKTKWILAIYIITIFSVIVLLGNAGESWEKDPSKSVKLIAISGIILQIAGFVFLLSPEIIKIKSKKEGNVKIDGILLVISGLVLQGMAIYLA